MAYIGLDFLVGPEGYLQTFKNVLSLGLTACQLTIGNLDIQDIIASRKFLEQHPGLYTCFHANVTYNLAGAVNGSQDSQFNRKLTNVKHGLLNELDIATTMNSDVIVHIGSRKDNQAGIHQIVKTLNETLIMENSNTLSFARRLGISITDFKNKRRLLLENCAGEGSKIGSSLDEIS